MDTISIDNMELAGEWVQQLRVTEPGELWWENLIDALVGLGKPAVLVLAEYLSDEDNAVVLGTAKAIERIARILQQEQERTTSRCHHAFQLRKYRTF